MCFRICQLLDLIKFQPDSRHEGSAKVSTKYTIIPDICWNYIRRHTSWLTCFRNEIAPVKWNVEIYYLLPRWKQMEKSCPRYLFCSPWEWYPSKFNVLLANFSLFTWHLLIGWVCGCSELDVAFLFFHSFGYIVLVLNSKLNWRMKYQPTFSFFYLDLK